MMKKVASYPWGSVNLSTLEAQIHLKILGDFPHQPCY